MKRTGKIIIALVTVLALGMIVAGCSCSNTDNKSNTTTSDTAKAAADNTTGTTDNAPNNLITFLAHDLQRMGVAKHKTQTNYGKQQHKMVGLSARHFRKGSRCPLR